MDSREIIPLSTLPIGSKGIVKEIITEGSSKRRLLDLGLIRNKTVESIRKSPSGDPTAYAIRGAVIAIRQDTASQIFVQIIPIQGGQ